MTSMRALVAFTHRGRALKPGDPLSAPPAEAAALKYQRKADFVTAAEAPQPKRKRVSKKRRDIQDEDLDHG